MCEKKVKSKEKRILEVCEGTEKNSRSVRIKWKIESWSSYRKGKNCARETQQEKSVFDNGSKRKKICIESEGQYDAVYKVCKRLYLDKKKEKRASVINEKQDRSNKKKKWEMRKYMNVFVW